MLQNWKDKIRERKEKLAKEIEYRRLKRVRRKKTPEYSYCKNCGRKLKGMYCSQCGQYALDIEQPFWKYMLQYVENVYQFDTKVWNTLYYMFRKPGFLTREFNAGKINSYVHPMRLFMFLSCLFFIYTFSIMPSSVTEIKERFDKRSMDVVEDLLDSGDGNLNYDELMSMTQFEDTVIWCKSDTALLRSIYQSFVNILESPYRDTARIQLPRLVFKKNFMPWIGSDTIYICVEDTVNQPKEARIIDAKEKLKDMKDDLYYGKILSWYSSWWPIIVLLLIPVFAFLLKFFFHKEKLGYMAHLVFALHLHSALLLLIAVNLLWYIYVYSGTWNLFLLLTAYSFLYTVVAVRRVYMRSSWIKAVLKTMLLSVIYMLIILTVFIYSLYWISENVI